MALLNKKKLKKSLAARQQRKEEEEARRARSGMNYIRLVVGNNYLAFCPPHENMDGVPWISRRIHFGLGPEENIAETCLRDNNDEPVSDCEACSESKALWKAGNKDDASRIREKTREIPQVLNFTEWVEEHGLKEKLPKCFTEYDEKAKKCDKKRCAAHIPCSLGPQPWTMPVGVATEIIGDFNTAIEEEDYDAAEAIVDLTNGQMYKINREGEGREDTKYSGVRFVKTAMKIKGKTLKALEERIADLSLLNEKKTNDEMRALIDEGHIIEDDEDQGDLPECFGDEDEFGAKKKKCKKCKYKKVCKEEIEEKSDDEDEEEEDVSKNKKKTKAKKKEEIDDEDEEKDDDSDSDDEDDEGDDDDDDEDDGDEDDDDDSDSDDDDEDDSDSDSDSDDDDDDDEDDGDGDEDSDDDDDEDEDDDDDEDDVKTDLKKLKDKVSSKMKKKKKEAEKKMKDKKAKKNKKKGKK